MTATSLIVFTHRTVPMSNEAALIRMLQFVGRHGWMLTFASALVAISDGRYIEVDGGLDTLYLTSADVPMLRLMLYRQVRERPRFRLGIVR